MFRGNPPGVSAFELKKKKKKMAVVGLLEPESFCLCEVAAAESQVCLLWEGLLDMPAVKQIKV